MVICKSLKKIYIKPDRSILARTRPGSARSIRSERESNGRSENINNRQETCYYLCKAMKTTQEGKGIDSITIGNQYAFITHMDGRIQPILVGQAVGTELIKKILNRL